MLTGRRENRKYFAEIGGARVKLTNAEMGTLCELAAARIGNTGPLSLERMKVRRLRLALDDGTGRPGLGDTLISPAGKGRYLLTVDATQTLVEPTVWNLLLAGCVDQVAADILLAWCEERSAAKPRAK